MIARHPVVPQQKTELLILMKTWSYACSRVSNVIPMNGTRPIKSDPLWNVPSIISKSIYVLQKEKLEIIPPQR